MSADRLDRTHRCRRGRLWTKTGSHAWSLETARLHIFGFVASIQADGYAKALVEQHMHAMRPSGRFRLKDGGQEG